MANIEFSALTDYVTKRLNDEEAQSGGRRLCADCAAIPAVFKTELLFSVVVWGSGAGGLLFGLDSFVLSCRSKPFGNKCTKCILNTFVSFMLDDLH